MIQNETQRREISENVHRLVIKVGSRILVDDKGRLDTERIDSLVSEIVSLHQKEYEIILVSSGAIAAGVQTLGWSERPSSLPELQMTAAIGQSTLMNRYTDSFLRHHCRIGQVLLTHADLNDRERHLNARNTMLTMLHNDVIPVVNENDVVAVDEIRFGDNDVLASMVSTLVDGDLLLLLTTSDGLFRVEDEEMKERIPVLKSITKDIMAMAQGKGSQWSSGGMASKLKAAKSASQTGTQVVIANGLEKNVIQRVLKGEDIGTWIPAEQRDQPLKARKKWIAFFHRPQGSIVVDDGAKKGICNHGNSLLPAGVDHTKGRFKVGSLVNIVGLDEKIIARGITSYSNDDIERIKGKHTTEIPGILGSSHFEEIIHRDNLVLIDHDDE